MTRRLDLREGGDDSRRDRVFEALDDTDTDETLELRADVDPAVTLAQYRIIREDTDLVWEYEREDPETWRLAVTVRDGDSDALPDFDVRDLRPQRRHEVLLETFDELEPSEGFVLVNDHDPKPLYHELRSTRGETFEWTYESRAADAWRVAIEKTDASSPPADDVTARYDVREIPKPERHPTIHHRYGMIPDGETMEIVAPHEPRPLHREFRERYGDAFAWTVVQDEPGECRVHITKAVDGEDRATGTADADSAGGESLAVVTELDVRDRPPAQRHEAIFEAYDELSPGEGFVFVNDHDPKPLYHQFDAETGAAFHWDYRQRESGEFRVLVGKTAAGPDDGARHEDAEAPF